MITMYCVIVECASFTLQNILDIWLDDSPNGKKKRLREEFTPEKLAFYFFQALSGISYMH